MKVSMKKNVGLYKAGSVVEMETARAEQYIAAKCAALYVEPDPVEEPEKEQEPVEEQKKRAPRAAKKE